MAGPRWQTLDLGQLARMAGVTPARLRGWQRAGVFPRRARYGWHDLQVAHKLSGSVAAALPRRRLYRSLRAARQRLGRGTDPLLEAGFALFANRLELHYEGGYVDALTGQMRLPFAADAAAVRIVPGSSGSADLEADKWFAYALSLEAQKSLRAQAAAAYERCLELNPAFIRAHINLGTLRFHQRDFAAAEACWRAALAMDPDYALAWFNLGNVLDETQRLSEAVEAYLAAVRLAPHYADAHYNLALAYQRLGLRRRALPHWNAYLELDRASPWATHARAQLKQALAGDVLQLVRRA